jgi:hypothetical protein
MQLQSHVFWSCPVAAAVRASISSALPRARHLPCSALWLLQAPSGVHKGVWSVVCAAAVEAMDWGRRYLWALTRQSEEAEELLDPTQTLITAFFPAVTPPVTQTPAVTAEDQRAERVRRASHRTVVHFWCLLSDFVQQIYVPDEWRGFPATHPFIGIQGEDAQATLRLNLPPGVVWEGH